MLARPVQFCVVFVIVGIAVPDGRTQGNMPAPSAPVVSKPTSASYQTRTSRAVSATSTPMTVERPAFDPAVLRGAYAVRARVILLDGRPAAGLNYRLTADIPRYGKVTAVEGTLPQNGIVYLKGLAGGSRQAPRFGLNVDNVDCGGFRLDDSTTTRALLFRVPPHKGDAAPDVRLVDVFTGKPVSLFEFRGQILYVDFWATWCAPCQGPMQHLQETLQTKTNDWKNRVAVLAVSIDGNTSAPLKRVTEKGWTAARQLWSPGARTGWESDAAAAYGIHSIPTSLLIDRNGKITWRGNPHGFDLVGEVDKLLH